MLFKEKIEELIFNKCFIKIGIFIPVNIAEVIT